jgi:hypothetical protein
MLRVRAGAEDGVFPSACFCVNTVSMKRQTVITKKRRGPAPTGKGTLIGVRLQPDQLKALDKWIDGDLSRPEGVRQLVESALAPKPEGFFLGAEMKSAIDAWMQGKDLSHAQAIAKLIELGLAKGK